MSWAIKSILAIPFECYNTIEVFSSIYLIL